MESSFGERLLVERRRLGLTQEEFGKLGGMTRLAQFTYEHNQHMPSVGYLEKLFRAKVDAVFLLTGRRLTRDQLDWDIAREAYTFVHRNYVAKAGKDCSPEKLFDLFKRLWETMMDETYGSPTEAGEATIQSHISQYE